MAEQEPILGLILSNLTLDEVKKLLKHLRDLETKNPQRTYFVQVTGLGKISLPEALRIMQEIFPYRPEKEGTFKITRLSRTLNAERL